MTYIYFDTTIYKELQLTFIYKEEIIIITLENAMKTFEFNTIVLKENKTESY